MKHIKVSSINITLFLSMINLLIMHYYILYTNRFLWENSINFYLENIFSCLFDVLVFYFFTYLITCKNIKIALNTVYFVTLLWSFTNVVYSRFFHQYISLSTFGHCASLFDSQMIKCIIDGLRWFDLYYIVNLFIILILKINYKSDEIIKLFWLLLFSISFDMLSLFAFCIRGLGKWYLHGYYNRHFTSIHHYSFPSSSNFVRGSIKVLTCEMLYNMEATNKLSKEQNKQIKLIIEKSQREINNTPHFINIPSNIIFIIVESYMSFTSDKKVNGKEVTPFLNDLKRDSSVFYNGLVNENVTIGESSDGQFVYMTGLLPLRSIVTVSKAKHTSLNSLPKLIKKESRMIIPTTSSMWSQDIMCRQYGFDSLFTCNDYVGEFKSTLNDEQVFNLAFQKDKEATKPFMSVILTMSMHQPYVNQIDSTFPIYNDTIPDDLACYLNACHYTDKQIEKYIFNLKQIGVYDKSLIIIASDHRVHNTDFNGVNKELPLYIVNVPSEIKKNMWTGKCNQLDVFTTILDLCNIQSDWYGIGQSLLSPDFHCDVNVKVAP